MLRPAQGAEAADDDSSAARSARWMSWSPSRCAAPAQSTKRRRGRGSPPSPAPAGARSCRGHRGSTGRRGASSPAGIAPACAAGTALPEPPSAAAPSAWGTTRPGPPPPSPPRGSAAPRRFRCERSLRRRRAPACAPRSAPEGAGDRAPRLVEGGRCKPAYLFGRIGQERHHSVGAAGSVFIELLADQRGRALARIADGAGQPADTILDRSAGAGIGGFGWARRSAPGAAAASSAAAAARRALSAALRPGPRPACAGSP